MHDRSLDPWLHEHTFGQNLPRPGERRTRIVIAVTAVTMLVEIAAGWYFGSMALLADGLHMASHAAALTISAAAYFYTRRHARDPRFTFGAGKINSLAAFASAVLLIVFALVMAVESVKRFLSPVDIEFNQAIAVAVLGLLVNGLCMLILGHRHSHDDHEHPHEHKHEHPHEHDHPHEHEHDHPHEHEHGHHHGGARDRLHEDHNLWSAYLHVLADALTSLLAIGALVAAKYSDQHWLDPLMGLVGAALVTRWSLGLLRASGGVLLDVAAPAPLRQSVVETIESEGDARVCDLHVWSIGPGLYAAELALVAREPAPPADYARRLQHRLPLAHVTVQVHRCEG